MSKKTLAVLLVFCLTFAVYLLTLCPTVAPRDSGELITAAYTLGIPHSPGYPLYTMLGKLFAFIPLGSIAWRVNLFSAVCAAAAASLTFLLIAGLTKSLLAAAAAALLLAFSPIFWWQAVVAEVFQLNLLFAVATVSLIVWWSRTKELKRLLLFAFVYGLSFSHHHTTALLAPGFLYFIWANDRTIFWQWKKILSGIFAFALGLIPYAYLPIRSLANPYIDWGDPQNLTNFIQVVTRSQFGSMKLDPSVPNAAWSFSLALAQARTLLGWLLDSFVCLGVLVGLIGAAANYKADRKLFWFCLLLFACAGPLFILLSRYPLDDIYYYPYCASMLSRFMLPAMFVFAVWVGYGAAALLTWAKGYRAKLFVALLLLALPCLSFSLHYAKADKSHFYYVDDLARNVLLSVKPNGIIFGNSDSSLFSLWYLQGAEGLRPDVRIVSGTPHKWRAFQLLRRYPGLVAVEPSDRAIAARIDAYPDGIAFLADIISTNLDKAPIYVDINSAPEFRAFYPRFAPAGMIYEILPTADQAAKLRALEGSKPLWGKYQFRSPLGSADRDDYFQYEILNLYAEARNYSGVVFALNNRYQEARGEFQAALAVLPDHRNALTNLAKLKSLGY
ncbi:MAG: DUF2723 domain-containing protein [Candidatus Margulisiibacteriota bacterium]